MHPKGRQVLLIRLLGLFLSIVFAANVFARNDPLPSWNDGATKQAIVAFVHNTTDQSSKNFVPVSERIATFDQDGTLWVEQPAYVQLVYCFDRVPALVKAKPGLANVEPFKTVMSGNRESMAKLTLPDLQKIAVATLTAMTVDQFNADVKAWLATAKDPRWKKPYTELVYQPLLELMQYLRENGYKTYIVTGGGQDFVRVFSESVYGIPPEQVVGSAVQTSFGYDKNGKPVLTKEPRLLLIDDKGGKPQGIYFMIGRRPVAAIGNSTGDREMLEYAQAGGGSHLLMLVHHDDAIREYAYGPKSVIGTFSDALAKEAKTHNWIVISMKDDWKRIFSFDQ